MTLRRCALSSKSSAVRATKANRQSAVAKASMMRTSACGCSSATQRDPSCRGSAAHGRPDSARVSWQAARFKVSIVMPGRRKLEVSGRRVGFSSGVLVSGLQAPTRKAAPGRSV